MNPTFDIGIIGGGLGGLTLALQAAQLGYRVVLWEKETYPFHKVCGEYISWEAVPFLERCGIDWKAWALPRIQTLQLSSKAGKPFHFSLEGGGIGVSRYQLDHALSQHCMAAGVTLRTGTKVQTVARLSNGGFQVEVAGEEEPTCAKVLVGAFGKRANLDVQWKRHFVTNKPDKTQLYVGIKYHIQYNNDPGTIALHHFQGGYCGLSSIEAGKSCLCYLTTAHNLAAHGQSIAQMEKNILMANPHLAEVFSTAAFLYEAPLAISQVNFAPKEQVWDGILLVGDAAGLITPLCGNGMSMSMQAGVLALEQIHSFLSGRLTRTEMEKAYAAAWQQHFKWRTRAGRFIQEKLGGGGAEGVMQVLAALPFLSQRVIRLTHGKPF